MSNCRTRTTLGFRIIHCKSISSLNDPELTKHSTHGNCIMWYAVASLIFSLVATTAAAPIDVRSVETRQLVNGLVPYALDTLKKSAANINVDLNPVFQPLVGNPQGRDVEKVSKYEAQSWNNTLIKQ